MIDEKVISNLEALWLNKEMISIFCQRRYHTYKLDKLKDLALFFGDNDNEEASTLPFEFFQKLPNLTSFSIWHCNALKELLPSQKNKDIYMLASVRASSPYSLSFLSSAVLFYNLKNLLINECHGLVFLMPSSVAKTLVQLEKMVIEDCKSLEQIVSPEIGTSASDKIIFEKLTTLTLNSLSSLVTFSLRNVALDFPTLHVATICDCPMMKIFSQGDIWAPNFMAIQASLDPYDLHYFKDLNSTVEKLFWDRVRDVQDLKLGDHLELEDVWHGVFDIPEMGFSKLKSLVMERCKICLVIPFHLLPYLSNLEELEVRNCDSVKAIFDVKGFSRNGMKVIDSGPTSPYSLHLKKLILEKLPNLDHIWNDDPQGILSLQCLQQACVDGCKSIKSLFPTSVAIDKLEKLEVKCCEGLEEIIAKDKTEVTSKVFIFHNLSSLTL